jgi:hypothetical protein
MNGLKVPNPLSGFPRSGQDGVAKEVHPGPIAAVEIEVGDP